VKGSESRLFQEARHNALPYCLGDICMVQYLRARRNVLVSTIFWPHMAARCWLRATTANSTYCWHNWLQISRVATRFGFGCPYTVYFRTTPSPDYCRRLLRRNTASICREKWVPRLSCAAHYEHVHAFLKINCLNDHVSSRTWKLKSVIRQRLCSFRITTRL
jgi:hypothetical protein